MDNEIISFDVETYYDATYSLSKMSVANYVKDPRFDCYLVSVHDKTGPVYIGRPEGFDWEKLDNKIVVAHNMSFDYVVLQRLVALGKVPRMPNAVEWACTADMSAWLGCKRSLKDASLILLGEEVSKATRSAMLGKASADLADNPDVLKYAGKDAELCYRLAEKYLDQWPEKERRISTLNREAGIRGIHTDVALVDAGIAALAPQLQAAMDKIPWVKDGDKPLSPNALRRHGLAVGIPVPASLAKDDPDFLAWAGEYSEKYPWVRAVGEYRSINALLCKVQSIRDGIDTATGMLPFGIKYYGAGTGRFCLPGSAEVLTPTGWRELQHWKGSSIMQWDPTAALRLAPASPNVFDVGAGSTPMIRAIGQRVDIVMTPEHKVPYFTSKKKLHVLTAGACYGKRIDVPVAGVYAGGAGVLSPIEVRLLVATQADGCFYVGQRDAAWQFGFKKERKYARLTGLLRELGIQHNTREDDSGLFVIAIQANDAPWYLSKTFSLGMLLACSAESLEAFMDELVNWDGTPGDGGSTEYNTTCEANALVVQTIAHITGRRASVVKRVHKEETWNDSYRVHIVRKKDFQLSRVRKWERVSINTRVYCPTTETGFFLCRYRGNVFITGNSGGAGEGGGRFNCQNLPRKPMYGVDVRPMFMARPGHTFITADYSQIEARYLLWVAGDMDALKPCAEGRSVYQAYAEKVGICTPDVDLKSKDPYMYQYVKAKILGSGYQCGGAKFKAFAKLYGVELSDEEAASDIAEFRKANPKIVQFWYGHHDALAYSARRKDDTHQVELRSGRVLTYWEPRVNGREMSAYQIRGAPRAYLYGGKLAENETQASCRDILCDAWIAVDKAGLPPVTLTVHDEIVMEVRKDEAAQIAKELEKCMVTCSPWAEGLPLGVDIHLTDRYTK